MSEWPPRPPRRRIAGAFTAAMPLLVGCFVTEGSSLAKLPGVRERAVCMDWMRERDLTAAEAEALPFVELSSVKALIERPIDEPLYWVPSETSGWRAVDGYETVTRVSIRSHITGYKVREIDQTLCDSHDCEVTDLGKEQCRPALLLTLASSVSTEDGSLDITLAGRASFSPPADASPADAIPSELTVHAIETKLSAVPGTISMQRSSGPEASSFDVQAFLTLTPEARSGIIAIDTAFDLEDGAQRSELVMPGYFPSLPKQYQ